MIFRFLDQVVNRRIVLWVADVSVTEAEIGVLLLAVCQQAAAACKLESSTTIQIRFVPNPNRVFVISASG